MVEPTWTKNYGFPKFPEGYYGRLPELYAYTMDTLDELIWRGGYFQCRNGEDVPITRGQGIRFLPTSENEPVFTIGRAVPSEGLGVCRGIAIDNINFNEIGRVIIRGVLTLEDLNYPLLISGGETLYLNEDGKIVPNHPGGSAQVVGFALNARYLFIDLTIPRFE